ncbi:archaemetzincin [Methanolinea mesophila]|uniref:archaemetzincin family Zn-dependent metalloprotease n=1 Tax=Methanolinea mesophila TaxID=547055 RepID=UPI001AE2D3EE|nr:archaemetzincin family Zn-dependent metalloprotease [Methanolinea mesophila]MBP1929881.1 archaemetzincin [Methanolinea mesophila]
MEILVLWDHSAPQGLQLPFTRALSGVLGLEVRVVDNSIPVNGYVGARRQVDAGQTLDSLDIYRHRSGISSPVLLVVSRDLFCKGQEFVFGLARPDVGVAILSTFRLENEYYGLPHDDDALLDRMVKEAAHEIGHLVSLHHCLEEECIMHNPLTLEDLDRKRRHFCSLCEEKLNSGKFR